MFIIFYTILLFILLSLTLTYGKYSFKIAGFQVKSISLSISGIIVYIFGIFFHLLRQIKFKNDFDILNKKNDVKNLNLKDSKYRIEIFNRIFAISQHFMETSNLKFVLEDTSKSLNSLLKVDTVAVRIFKEINILEEVNFSFPPQKMVIPEIIVNEIKTRGNSILNNNLANDVGYGRLTKQGYTSMCIAPIKRKNLIMGMICVFTKEKRTFMSSELDILTKFGAQISTIIENAKLLETLKKYNIDVDTESSSGSIDHEKILVNFATEQKRTSDEKKLSNTIITELLPSNDLKITNLELCGHYLPAKEVGGDYYDIIPINDELTAITIGDVSGKGVPAALVMVMIRTIIRQQLRLTISPLEIVKTINKYLVDEGTTEKYATLGLVLINTKDKKIEYSSAGHGPLYVYGEASKSFRNVDTEGIPIGITKDSNFEETSSSYSENDLMVLTTDGITEAMSKEREEYSLERFLKIVEKNHSKTPKDIVEIIKKEIETFSAGAKQHDDQTLLILRLK